MPFRRVFLRLFLLFLINELITKIITIEISREKLKRNTHCNVINIVDPVLQKYREFSFRSKFYLKKKKEKKHSQTHRHHEKMNIASYESRLFK